MASTSSSSAHSRTPINTAQMMPGTPAIDRGQPGRHRSSVLRNLHGMASRHTSRCTSSSSDTIGQGEVPRKDAPNADDVEPDPKPFPKVGDVVRYMGKWENEISLGEVRQCPKHVCALRLLFLLRPCLCCSSIALSGGIISDSAVLLAGKYHHAMLRPCPYQKNKSRIPRGTWYQLAYDTTAINNNIPATCYLLPDSR